MNINECGCRPYGWLGLDGDRCIRVIPRQSNSLYKITGKTMENSDIGITRETYRQGYTLIGFDVDPTTSPDFRYVGKPREGHTNLK